MNNLEKKRKRIFRISLSSIILIPIGIIFFVVVPFVTAALSSVHEPIYVDYYSIILIILTILGTITFIISGILGLIAAILTLTFPKTQTDLDDKRIIFGIFGILLIGPLMPLIFSCIAKKYIEKSINNDQAEIML